MTAVDDILAHFGKRGMKWGVRNDESGTAAGVTVKTASGKRGVAIKTSGGRGHPASDDAVRSAVNKQKAKGSSIHSLSNDELNKVIARMNLEKSFMNVTAKKDGPAKAFIKKLLGDTAKSEVTALSKGNSGPLMKQLDTALASQSKGRHVIRTATLVSPAVGRHRF